MICQSNYYLCAVMLILSESEPRIAVAFGLSEAYGEAEMVAVSFSKQQAVQVSSVSAGKR